MAALSPRAEASRLLRGNCPRVLLAQQPPSNSGKRGREERSVPPAQLSPLDSPPHAHSAQESHFAALYRREMELVGPRPPSGKADMTAEILREIAASTRFGELRAWASAPSADRPAVSGAELDDVMAVIGLIFAYAFGMRLSDLVPAVQMAARFNPNVSMTTSDVRCFAQPCGVPAIEWRPKVLKNDKYCQYFRRWSSRTCPTADELLCPASAWAVRLAFAPPAGDRTPLLPGTSGSHSVASLRKMAHRGLPLAPQGATSLSCRHGCATALLASGASSALMCQYQRWRASGSWQAYAAVTQTAANNLLRALF
jgi:hypothetical protein